MRAAILRASASLILLLSASNALRSQTLAAAQGGLPPPSITILLDLSYSMRLPLSLNKDDPHGATRIEEAKRLLYTLLDRQGIRWSLLAFGSEEADHSEDSQVQVVQNFTENTAALKRKIAGLSTWGLTPLHDAILFAERYADRNLARGGRSLLLVVSDGIDTVPELYKLPTAHELRRFSTPILFAGIDLKRAPDLAEALGSWMQRAGGAYVDAAHASAVSAVMKSILSRPAAGGTGAVSQHAAAPSPPATAAPRGDLGSNAARRARPVVLPNWFAPRTLPFALALLLALPLLVLLLRRLKWRRASRRARSLRASEIVTRFQRESKGEVKQFETRRPRVSLVPSDWARPTTVLPTVEIRDGRATMRSPGPVVVNGVGVRQKILERGDRIHIPGFIWTYRGVEVRTSGPPDPPRPKALPHLLASSFLLLCAGALLGWYLLPPRLATTQPVASTPPVPSQRVVARAAPASFALAGSLAPVEPYLHTQMVAPGQKPDYFKADIMFIHAHPDDDSINFGGLMAMEARSGKRIVSVIFTDGTAGLDQYPYRRVGGIYPDHSLSARALARVRVDEAESALSILGSEAYVRLGLRNNPYDSVTEILPLHEVLRRWGGEAHVVGELVRLLEGYRPTIVVSPDKAHYGVFTHFEHEAVGYVTDRALAYLSTHGQHFVRAHLIGVDPMFTAEYHRVFGIDVMRRDPQTGLTYRAIQVAALEQHRTQRDASVIAVEVVPNFDDEYYVAQFWRLPAPPLQYFTPPEVSPPVAGGTLAVDGLSMAGGDRHRPGHRE